MDPNNYLRLYGNNDQIWLDAMPPAHKRVFFTALANASQAFATTLNREDQIAERNAYSLKAEQFRRLAHELPAETQFEPLLAIS